MNLDGRVAVVTGGAGLLGRAVIDVLWAAGASLALPLRSPESRLPGYLSDDPGRFLRGTAELTDTASVRAFVEAAAKRFGVIDILVNLAGGYAGGKPVEEHSLEEWERMMAQNLTTAFVTTREVLPYMKRSARGRIINVTSLPGIRSGGGRAAYAVSKRGVIALTEAIADEVKGTAITANAVAPGIVLGEGETGGKGVSAAEIARVILFLCSDDASAVNGNVLKLFGGMA